MSDGTTKLAFGREGAQGLAQRQHVEAILSSAGAEPPTGRRRSALGREVGDEDARRAGADPPGGAGRFVEQALLDQHDDARAAAGLRAQARPLSSAWPSPSRSKLLKRSQMATTSDVPSCGPGAATSRDDARRRSMSSTLHPRGAQSWQGAPTYIVRISRSAPHGSAAHRSTAAAHDPRLRAPARPHRRRGHRARSGAGRRVGPFLQDAEPTSGWCGRPRGTLRAG